VCCGAYVRADYLNTIGPGGGGETAFPLANNATLAGLQQAALAAEEERQQEQQQQQHRERAEFEGAIHHFRATDAAR
jgi:hypothetical protein